MYLLVNVTPLNWSGGFHLFLVNTELFCSFFSLPWVVEEDAKIQVYRWIGAGNRKENRFINRLRGLKMNIYTINYCIKVILWTLKILVTLNKIPQSLSHNGDKFCGSCGRPPNPKGQLGRYPNRETMGNNDKQQCAIVFCDQWGHTLWAAPI